MKYNVFLTCKLIFGVEKLGTFENFCARAASSHRFVLALRVPTGEFGKFAPQREFALRVALRVPSKTWAVAPSAHKFCRE